MATYCPRQAASVSCRFLHCAHVTFSKYGHNPPGVTPAEIIKSFSSSICRTIFADDELVFEIHALSKHALQGLRKKASWLYVITITLSFTRISQTSRRAF